MTKMCQFTWHLNPDRKCVNYMSHCMTNMCHFTWHLHPDRKCFNYMTNSFNKNLAGSVVYAKKLDRQQWCTIPGTSWFRFRFQFQDKPKLWFQFRFRFQQKTHRFHSDSDSNPKPLIPVPIPIPACSYLPWFKNVTRYKIPDSDSDSKTKFFDSDSSIFWFSWFRKLMVIHCHSGLDEISSKYIKFQKF